MTGRRRAPRSSSWVRTGWCSPAAAPKALTAASAPSAAGPRWHTLSIQPSPPPRVAPESLSPSSQSSPRPPRSRPRSRIRSRVELRPGVVVVRKLQLAGRRELHGQQEGVTVPAPGEAQSALSVGDVRVHGVGLQAPAVRLGGGAVEVDDLLPGAGEAWIRSAYSQAPPLSSTHSAYTEARFFGAAAPLRDGFQDRWERRSFSRAAVSSQVLNGESAEQQVGPAARRAVARSSAELRTRGKVPFFPPHARRSPA